MSDRVALIEACAASYLHQEPAKTAQLSKARARAEAALQRAEDVWLEASASYENTAT